MEYRILKAPKEIFKSSGTAVSQAIDAANVHKSGEVPTEYVVFSDGKKAIIWYPATGQRIEADDASGKHGIYRHKTGLLYPVKGFSDPDISFALNGVKQTMIALLISLSWPLLIGVVFLPKKRKIAIIERVLHNLLRPFGWLLSPYFLKDEYYSVFAKELRGLVYTWLVEVGLSSQTASGFSEVIAMAFENDDGYSMKAKDIFSLTTPALLSANPRKELGRLLTILLQRIINDPPDKYAKFYRLLSFLLYLPFVKRAFITAVRSVEFANLQYDEADKYHILYRSDYNFEGRTFDERYRQFVDIHKGNIPDAIRI